MTYRIRKKDSDNWLWSHIDSGGMSVGFTGIIQSDEYPTREVAQSMIDRCKERYPNEKLEIVPRD